MSKNSKYDSYYSEEEPGFSEKVRTFFMKNRKKNLKALIITLIVIVVIVALMVGAYVIGLLNKINRNEITGDPDATFSEESDNYDDVDPISDVYADTIDQYCIEWATTGDKLQSSSVINVLLIGQDEGGTNSDTIIIASVNTEAKKITLCSVMRDSYTYSNINGSARCDKINHTFAWGGPTALKTTIEDDLKITIDYYATVDFDAFRDMIDEIGGVDVPVTEAEADYMNRTTQMQGFESGDSVHLDGKHALVFARIRKLDSDINRTHRQRLIISAVISKLKNSSLSELNSLVNKFLPYVNTDCPNNQILSYASKAISGGWLKYEINEFTEPSENYRKDGMMTTYSSRSSKLFVWIVDWGLVAKEVQPALYGTTNIVIDESNHVSPIDIANGDTGETTTYGYGYSSSYYYGDYYYTTGYSTTTRSFWNYTNSAGIIPDFRRTTAQSETQEYTTQSYYVQDDTSVTQPYSETETRSRYYTPQYDSTSEY